MTTFVPGFDPKESTRVINLIRPRSGLSEVSELKARGISGEGGKCEEKEQQYSHENSKGRFYAALMLEALFNRVDFRLRSSAV
jgi:hypothetical protein